MNTPTVSPNTPTIGQLVAAFAQALLPFAGAEGVAAAAVIPAVEQLLTNLQGVGNGVVYTMDDLEAVAAKTTTDLAQLGADVGQATS